MKHYWVLGLFGISVFVYAEYSRGGLWFQGERAVATTVVADARSDQGTDFHWASELSTGMTVEIKGVNGDIKAEPSPNGRLEVYAEKHSRRSDISAVRVEVVEHSNGITFCAVYPSRGDRRNVCAPGTGGRMNVRNNDVKVEFRVLVPAGLTLVTRNVNGDVTALNLKGNVIAKTVNGDVEIGTEGGAEAETVNGSIEAAVGMMNGSEGLSFETVNGQITLRMPQGINADFSGGTVNGSISSDFPLTIRGRQGPRSFSGVLGTGGPRIRLTTVNGSIRLIER